jgi:hypothetical protein
MNRSHSPAGEQPKLGVILRGHVTVRAGQILAQSQQ